MARLSGIELNDNWKLGYALTRLKGIGWPLSDAVLKELSISKLTKMKELSSDDLSKLNTKLDEYTIEGDLVRQVRGNISRLQVIGSYRGVRHSRGLPVRGQRTRRNARTKRGKRKTVGAFKKDMLAKQAAPAGKDSK